MSQMILQYILGYCTWKGLSIIGEPPLTNNLSLEADSIRPPGHSTLQKSQSGPWKDPMPAWLIFLFFALGASRYILSYLIWYVFQVISTVAMVSSEDTSVYAAAFARKHPKSKKLVSNRPREEKRPFKKVGTFRPEPFSRKNRTFTRALTMPIESLGRRFFGLACLRGLSPFLIVSITQWYFGAISDLFLSGQPKELESGYGASSIILTVFFGGSYALWTHYAITEPSDFRSINDHFPKNDVLVELYPITTLWALCEQMTRSLPLALSRSSMFELRDFAWTPALWNRLKASGQRSLFLKFGVVYLLYLLLVASLLIPASMTLRRIHASMLPDADEAIVPFTRGNPTPRDDEDSSTHSPGLSISQAWATLSWNAYFRVLRTFILYFIVNQLLHLLCWEAHWMLHDVFEADQFDASQFPAWPTRLDLHFFQ